MNHSQDATSKRDPVCGMQGTLERHGQWFCSEHCATAYAKQQAAAPAGALHVHARRHWLLDPWVWVPLSGLGLWSAGWWFPPAAAVSEQYRGYVGRVLVPSLIGLVIGGLVDHYVPREYIIRWLSGSRKRVIARATLLGFLASTCSHGCLALSLELYRKGASVPAVVSFLLASPWASMSLTLILLSLFGLHGLTIVVSALVVAFITGLIFQRLARRGLLETNPNTITIDASFSIRADIARRYQAHTWTPAHLAQDARGVARGTWSLGRMVLGWVQLGLILSAALGALVPQHVFLQYLGPTPAGLLLTLLGATLIEVCSEGTAPLAYELYRQTGALGNAFVFLMSGVVTDYTELGALWKTIGRRTVFWLVTVTLPIVCVIGLLLNWIRW